MAAPTYALFVPECHADTALMLTLLRENAANRAPLRNYVSHRQGIGKVGQAMERQPRDAGNARRVLGLVDYDARFAQQPYLAEFALWRGGLDRRRDTHAILRHPRHPSQWLIALLPACDQWLLSRAAEARLDPAAFGLPPRLPAFAAHCKTRGVDEPDTPLRRLLAAIATARPPAYAALAECVAQVMDLENPLP